VSRANGVKLFVNHRSVPEVWCYLHAPLSKPAQVPITVTRCHLCPR